MLTLEHPRGSTREHPECSTVSHGHDSPQGSPGGTEREEDLERAVTSY